jgi:hypothetical protein
MSASLIVLVPPVLLGLVTALCFVGCVLNRYGTGDPIGPGPGPIPFTGYRKLTVLGSDSLVAFWPLDDAANSPQAAELKSGLVGNYVTMNTNPTQFPDPPIPNVSAPAAGKLAWGQAGIVPGDCINNDPNNPSPCIQVDGGYVSVPQQEVTTLNLPSFTVEAWVRVDWKANDPAFPPAFRTVIDYRTVAGGNVTGFALFATPENNWAVEVGGGAAGGTVLTGQAVAFDGKPTYLAATYDGGTQTLSLFVNGLSSVAPMPGVAYMQNTTAPLFIGSGAPSFPLRPQPPAVPLDQTAPLTPFVGAIQDVAIYSTALPSTGTMDANDVIFTHAQNGNGTITGG